MPIGRVPPFPSERSSAGRSAYAAGADGPLTQANYSVRVFTRRGRDSATDEAPNPVVDAGKGRATPKRSEAERERRERIKPSTDPRQRRVQERKRRVEQRTKAREAID